MFLCLGWDASCPLACPTPVHFGSVCSGSELFLSVLGNFDAIVADEFQMCFLSRSIGLLVELPRCRWEAPTFSDSQLLQFACWSDPIVHPFRAVFVCENEGDKAASMDANNVLGQEPKPPIFKDLHQMANNPGAAELWVGGTMRVQVGQKFTVAGTSCRDASRPSTRHSVTGRDAIRTCQGATASTFHALVKLDRHCNAKRVYQVNVFTLHDKSPKTKLSNYDEMKSSWHGEGRRFSHCNMALSIGGLPARRPRVYMIDDPVGGGKVSAKTLALLGGQIAGPYV